jgi:uncharacterized protein (DUF2252 family)
MLLGCCGLARHGRMMVSPFTFYRGAAVVMAADLAPTPVAGLEVQLCGDAHLSNFGLFASPERLLLFDVNDFDETLPGPFEYDVKRMAASFTVAGRGNGFAKADTRAAGQAEKAQKRAVKIAAKAHRHDSLQALSKLAEPVNGSYRIVSQPPVVVPLRDPAGTYGLSAEEAEQAIRDQFRAYRATLQDDRRHLLEQFEIIDAARKVVGVGSVGTRCFIVLLQGRDAQDRCSFRSRRRWRRCWRRMWARAATGSTASGWCRDSGSCKPPATSTSAGPRAWTCAATSTGANCAT